MVTLDSIDHKILEHLQRNSSIGMEELGRAAGISRNGCWRRIRALEDLGVITKRTVILDPEALGLGLSVFIMLRAARHDDSWLKKFSTAVQALPEVLGAYRMTGDLDYLLHARIADMPSYDRLYRRLVARVELSDVSASFVMEEIKNTTELPL